MRKRMNYIDKVFSFTKKETFTYATRPGYPALYINFFTPVSETGAPVGDLKKPVVWVLHGGGGYPADPATEGWAKNEFCPRGYVSACVMYKTDDHSDLNLAHRISAINFACAIRYARLKRNLLGINQKNFFSFGRSWGGLTAAHENVIANNLSDPYFADDFNALYATYPGSGLPVLSNVSASASIAGAVYPHILPYVDAADSPHFDHHFENDNAVPYQLAVDTAAAFDAVGVLNHLLPFPGQGHTDGKDAEVIADLAPRFASLIKV